VKSKDPSTVFTPSNRNGREHAVAPDVETKAGSDTDSKEAKVSAKEAASKAAAQEVKDAEMPPARRAALPSSPFEPVSFSVGGDGKATPYSPMLPTGSPNAEFEFRSLKDPLRACIVNGKKRKAAEEEHIDGDAAYKRVSFCHRLQGRLGLTRDFPRLKPLANPASNSRHAPCSSAPRPSLATNPTCIAMCS